MTSNELRKKFIEFFVARNHKLIPPAPLMPLDDPTTLFTSSGMQQLVPYFKGEIHPMGKRLVDSQPSFRAEDIEEIGDNRHTTFFEMLGNWSLGGYFKKEQLAWFWEFLIKELGLDKDRLYVTVFCGDKIVPKDEESISFWQKLFDIKTGARDGKLGFDVSTKIYSYDASKNWWSRSGPPDKMPIGEIGGPDSEVFYDFGEELKIHENSKYKDKTCHVNCDCGRFLEIGNSVFIEYEKQKDGSFKPLPQKNVDFGGGLLRLLAVLNHDPDVFKTDLFLPIIQTLENFSGKKYQGNELGMRVIADHLTAAVFMAKEGLKPSNKKQGYILRRLIRKALIKMRQLELEPAKTIKEVCSNIITIYQKVYFNNEDNRNIIEIITTEANEFAKTINKAGKLVRGKQIDGKLLFNLYQSYGLPLEISQEICQELGEKVSPEAIAIFNQEKNKHQQLSRIASQGMFKGGLADHSEIITKLHTATHLLHASLRNILGNHVQQVGSNITQERLRFDFTHPKPLTKAEISKVEKMVNEQIKNNLKITMEIMSLKEAQNKGALAFFGQKYPEKVKVYSIGTFSMEVCGGPHASFTGTLGKFMIMKEESSGAGKRRIYAVVQ